MATVSIEEKKRLARHIPEDVATERNFDLVEEVCAEDCIEHGAFGERTEGRDANLERLRNLLDAFPDFEATVEDIVAEDDEVAMRVTLRGTHEGEFMGIEPTGNSFEVQNMVFTRIEDGKIVERWTQPDTLGMFQQLGIAESPMD
ncbi:ester cyclase [Haladaptatus sp. NG-WS-4]